jgi:HD-like signal output (HDOD) protein
MAAGAESLLIRRYIDRAMVDFPPMPHVVVQVVQRVESETVTTQELNDMIIQDSAITTKLLKVVNSAYFGMPRQITQISHAVSILGLQQVRNLLLSLGVLNAMRSTNPRVLKMQEAFWKQAFASGIAAEFICQKKGLARKERETVFIGSLLQDIGRLFLITMFNLPYQEVVRESVNRDESLLLTETRILGASHTDLGGALADRWNFPQSLGSVIRNHEGPFIGQASAEEFIVHLSGYLSFEVVEAELIGRPPILAPAAAAWAGLTAGDLEAIREKMRASLEQTSQMLGMV